jgi:hypothetical protein
MKTKSIIVVVLLSTFAASPVFAGLNDGLISYHPFNGNANDETGNGHDGTVSGAILTADRFGNANSAYSFDGIDDGIEILNSADFGFSGSFSVSLWVQIVDNADLYRHFIWFGENFLESFPEFCIAKSRSGYFDGPLYTELYTNTHSKPWVTSLDNGEQLPKNEWLHLVSIVDSGEHKLKFYLNDSLQGSIDYDSLDLSVISSLKVYIGRCPGPAPYSGFHYGLLDDVRVYNRTLSETEITELYTVPEPATLLLFGLGAVVLRRKR